MSFVGTASISPRPISGGPARSPTLRRNSKALLPSFLPFRTVSKLSGGSGFATQSGPRGRTCCTKPPNGCDDHGDVVPLTGCVSPSSGSKNPMLPAAVSWSDVVKLPKVVKAAVLPVLKNGSRWSGALPPPVVSLSEVNSKFVSVERAARVTLDTLVQLTPGVAQP